MNDFDRAALWWILGWVVVQQLTLIFHAVPQ